MTPDVRRKRIAQLLLLVAGVTLVLVLGREWPRTQTVHVILGDAAPRVLELGVQYAPQTGGEYLQGASFRYAAGAAPRIVTHEPRLADGEYGVEIEITTANDQRTIVRRVALQGGVVSIDVAQAVPR